MSRLLAAAFIAQLAIVALPASTLPAIAGPKEDLDAMMDALRMPEILDIMHDEGIVYGEELQEGILQGRGGKSWDTAVEALYDPVRMETALRKGLAEGLDSDQMAAITAFYQSEAGKELAAGEVAARRAFLDESVKDAAIENWPLVAARGGPRWDMLVEFADVNELVEMNVAAAMTANYAFYRGLADGGAFGGSLTEEQIITDVWSREDEINQQTVDWVYSYISLAYQPVSDEVLRSYVDFSRSPEGRAMNVALFAAFGEILTAISGDLGRSAAKVLEAQDL